MKISAAENWSKCYQVELDGVDFKSNARNRIAMGLLHLSLEHHQSIINLAKCNLLGSLFALLRCQFEALLRGIWFLRCASDSNIEKFVANKNLDLVVSSLIEDVEKTEGYQHGALKRYKAGKWKAMNDYTHGGFFQVASRTAGDEISGRNLSEHLSWALTESNKLSLLAILDLCQIIERPELSKNLSATYFEYIEESP
ncbi:DUF6988 family protein [Marinomonas dokdonensis]|uniref:DUF6988 family protein n=1 Tax=Marinomonas dokdonensis TaxID=328224 RepID=UPI004055884E